MPRRLQSEDGHLILINIGYSHEYIGPIDVTTDPQMDEQRQPKTYRIEKRNQTQNLTVTAREYVISKQFIMPMMRMKAKITGKQ